LKKLRVHHIAVGAQDPQRVATFYTHYFGAPELRRNYYPDGSLRSIWLDLDFVLMVEHISESERPEEHSSGMRPGMFLIALSVDAQQRNNLETAWAADGVQVDQKTEFTTYARDPEANRVAISTYPFEERS
jgi:catechol 2,3-dioxygenase-like lactoylglutathione lyase family enzyme